MPRPAHHHRHAEGLFVHEAFVEPSMLAQIEALVGGVDNYCVLVQSGTFQVVQNLSYTFVHACHNTHIVLQIALVFPLCHFFERTLLRVELIITVAVRIKEAAALVRLHSSQESVRPRIEQ